MPKEKIYKDHRVAEIIGICDVNLITDPAKLRSHMDYLTTWLGLSVVNQFMHQFSPHGITMVDVVEESHVAMHTWPEERYAHLDIFTCSPHTRISLLKPALSIIFPAEQIKVREIYYGNPIQRLRKRLGTFLESYKSKLS